MFSYRLLLLSLPQALSSPLKGLEVLLVLLLRLLLLLRSDEADVAHLEVVVRDAPCVLLQLPEGLQSEFHFNKHKQIAPSVQVPGFTFPSKACLCVCVFVGHKSRFHAVSNRRSQKVHSTPCCTTLYNTDQFWRSVPSSPQYGLSVILEKTNYNPYISSSGSTSSLNHKFSTENKLTK